MLPTELVNLVAICSSLQLIIAANNKTVNFKKKMPYYSSIPLLRTEWNELFLDFEATDPHITATSTTICF